MSGPNSLIHSGHSIGIFSQETQPLAIIMSFAININDDHSTGLLGLAGSAACGASIGGRYRVFFEMPAYAA
jgi:hypothetical protein